MDFTRRQLLYGVGGSVVLSLTPFDIAKGAKMVDVRMWPADEYTRLTLESDVPLKHKHFFIRSGKPLRLVVDIEGLELTASLRKLIAAVKPEDPYITSIRVGQYTPKIVRLVIELKEDVKPEVFLLQPFANYKYRLVFDLYPVTPKDEISRLLAGVEEGSEPIEPQPDELTQIIEQSISKPGSGAQKPPQTEKKPPVQRKLLIVVDPGHGGEDPGAIGRRKNREKTVVLQIGKRLARLINEEPNMKAILTRSSDHFVSLGGRVAIARKARAHMLVSIHADAWIKSSARGSSVFCLSRKGATSSAAKWLAKSQNESDLIGGVNIAAVDRTLASVLVDMTSSWTIDYSLGLGTAVLEELGKINRLHKKHVEQAGFAVLKGQGIPSILVETAFISNPEEERLLITWAHQEKIAKAILTGIKKQLAANPSLLRS